VLAKTRMHAPCQATQLRRDNAGTGLYARRYDASDPVTVAASSRAVPRRGSRARMPTAVVRRLTLTYAATIVVALVAHQARRPDRIRAPKRALAHGCVRNQTEPGGIGRLLVTWHH